MEMERIAQKVHTKMQKERKQTPERKRAIGKRRSLQTLSLPYQSPRHQTSQPPDRRTNDTFCIVTSLRSELLITVEEDKRLKLRTSHLACQVHRGVCYHSLSCTARVDSSRITFPYYPDYTLSLVIAGIVTNHQILQFCYNLIS